ncbi:hypothetical protein BKA69DRAFT_1071840 [Paraphysoderma sedebokerense]|nr:hypothetical protein BKA69DRAFT_1071840 [Paraphysoderma sedebokerense]
MSGIGPQLPPHLQKRSSSSEAEASPPSQIGPQVPSKKQPSQIGPTLPPHLQKKKSVQTNDESDSSISEGKSESVPLGPQLPPHLSSKSQSSSHDQNDNSEQPKSKKRVLGPSLPSSSELRPSYYVETQAIDDDDDFGPKPLPKEIDPEEYELAMKLKEIEDRNRKMREEMEEVGMMFHGFNTNHLAIIDRIGAHCEFIQANRPKKVERGEWMLVPPDPSSGIPMAGPASLKSRSFASRAKPTEIDKSWTETPAEKRERLQQKALDSSSSKKKRPRSPSPPRSDRDVLLAASVQQHNESHRAQSLLTMYESSSDHMQRRLEQHDDPTKRGWDRDKDMAGGKRMDVKQRQDVIKKAGTGLGGRFGGGGFL